MDTIGVRSKHIPKLSKRDQVGLSIFAVVLCVCAVGGYFIVHRVLKTFGMTNQTYQETASPDGKYMATLAYRDGLTFGYEYLSLQPKSEWHSLLADDPIPKDEVAEMGDEGIDSIVWLNPHTLLVKYDKSVSTDCFVQQSRSWRDVQIVWRGIVPH